MHRHILRLLLASAVLACSTTRSARLANDAAKPPAAAQDPKSHTFFGETLVDEFHWLRKKGTPEVEAHLRAENEYTAAAMRPTGPLQAALYGEMLARIKETDLSVPYKDGSHFYYSRTEKGKQYPILCRKAGSPEAPEQIYLDVNELARGRKFMSLGAHQVSDDGNLLAFSTDQTGFRQFALHLKDLRTGAMLPDTAERVTSLAWAGDGKTLFYVTEDAQTKRPDKLFRHVLGAAADALVYEEKDERFNLDVQRTRSKAFLVVESASRVTSEVRVIAAGEPASEPRLIAPREQDHEYSVDHGGGVFYILTNSGGRNFRLVTAPVENPGREHWKEILPHRPSVRLEDVEVFATHYVLYEREDALPHLRIADLASGESHRVSMPEPIYLAALAQNREFDSRTLRFNYQSFVTPSSVFDYDVGTRQRRLLKETEVPGGWDRTRYASERLHATAADGTRVPVSVLYKKGTPRDGTAPALLYAYGSYGASISPGFSSNVFSLVDRGFVYALAHIRGGGDLGKPWHDAGRMMNKRNTFTDFIACAEHLVAGRFTAKDRLAIQGGSAGGLLMGAVVNMRPDLFRAVVAKVPFVDVINTMSDASLPLTVNEFEEWGNPKVEEQYRYIRTYSPYENVERKPYPSILVVSAYNDSQVMYWEPAKWVARLRARKSDANPLLLKIDMDPAGHGGKSGRYERLREVAFEYAFLLSQLQP